MDYEGNHGCRDADDGQDEAELQGPRPTAKSRLNDAPPAVTGRATPGRHLLAVITDRRVQSGRERIKHGMSDLPHVADWHCPYKAACERNLRPGSANKELALAEG